MAKVIYVKDKIGLNPTYNDKINEVLGILPDNHFIKTKQEIVNLSEWDELKSAFVTQEPTLIRQAKLKLVKQFCTDDQRLILNGNWDIAVVAGTLDEVQAQEKAVIPKQDTLVWKDEAAGKWKKLEKHPNHPTRFEGGKFVHNYDDAENSEIINA